MSSLLGHLLSPCPTVQLPLSAGVVRKVNVFFSQQTEQTWDPPASASLSEDGAAIWLPPRLMVELRMVPAVGEDVPAQSSGVYGLASRQSAACTCKHAACWQIQDGIACDGACGWWYFLRLSLISGA